MTRSYDITIEIVRDDGVSTRVAISAAPEDSPAWKKNDLLRELRNALNDIGDVSPFQQTKIIG